MIVTRDTHIGFANKIYFFELQQKSFLNDFEEYKCRHRLVNNKDDKIIYKYFHTKTPYSILQCFMEDALLKLTKDYKNVYYNVGSRVDTQVILESCKKLSASESLTVEDIEKIIQNETDLIKFIKECISVCGLFNISTTKINKELKNREKQYLIINTGIGEISSVIKLLRISITDDNNEQVNIHSRELMKLFDKFGVPNPIDT